MTTPEDVIREARTWMHVPFHHQGRVRAGVDCIGLVIVVSRTLGLLPPDFDFKAYGRNPNGELEGKIAAYCPPLAEPQPGCVLVIKWWKLAHHVAILTGPTMIHSHQAFQGVAEHRFDDRWRKRCLSFHALPGVTYER